MFLPGGKIVAIQITKNTSKTLEKSQKVAAYPMNKIHATEGTILLLPVKQSLVLIEWYKNLPIEHVDDSYKIQERSNYSLISSKHWCKVPLFMLLTNGIDEWAKRCKEGKV